VVDQGQNPKISPELLQPQCSDGFLNIEILGDWQLNQQGASLWQCDIYGPLRQPPNPVDINMPPYT